VLVSLTLLSLAAQYPPGTAQFVLLDSTPPGSPERDYLEGVVKAVPQGVVLARGAELSETFGRLAGEAKRRTGQETAAEAPAVFLLVHGLQNFKKLRQEDEFSFSASDSDAGANPAGLLKELLTEGPTRGLHVVATVDTYNNVTRFVGRKLLTEFEMRVLFQMSAADSASLIDSPAASTLGLHRALYYNDREGFTETFRPYARPGGAWLEEAARQLARRRADGE
jgi:S-DNA-T family DNA segregation ATPase FtsK/SpoIIIE